MAKNKRFALVFGLVVTPVLLAGVVSCGRPTPKAYKDKRQLTSAVATHVGDYYTYDLTFYNYEGSTTYFDFDLALNKYDLEFKTFNKTFQTELMPNGREATYRCTVDIPLPLNKTKANVWYASYYTADTSVIYANPQLKVTGNRELTFTCSSINNKDKSYSYKTIVEFKYKGVVYDALVKDGKKATFKANEDINPNDISFVSAYGVKLNKQADRDAKNLMNFGRNVLLLSVLGVVLPGIIVFFVVFFPKILRKARIRREQKEGK